MAVREAFAAVLLLLTCAACRPAVFAGGELDRLEAVLAPTPAQRPAWEAFRREAQAADSNWSRDLRGIMAAPAFDAHSARAAADSAHRDAGRLIEAWRRVDEGLSPGQRAALRRANGL